MIELGSKVKDTVTGFEGITTSRTEYLNGCIQYGVAPRCKKNNEIIEEVQFDEQVLEVLTIKKKKIIKKAIPPPGGPMRKAMKMR